VHLYCKELQKVTNTLFYTDEGVTFEDDIDEEDNMIFGQGTFNNLKYILSQHNLVFL
jgi:hypothetical protein